MAMTREHLKDTESLLSENNLDHCDKVRLLEEKFSVLKQILNSFLSKKRRIVHKKLNICESAEQQFSRQRLGHRCPAHFRAARTSANSNCLFNACSISLFGDESLSDCLRCLCAIELFVYAEFYANHPILKELLEKNAIINENNAFVKMLSYAASESFTRENRIPSIYKEASCIAKNATYASFICVLALSSVISHPIEAYYPIQNESEGSNQNMYELMFNCCIYPRDEHKSDIRKIHLFRCSSTDIDFLFSGRFSKIKDHYVPLLPLDMFNSKKGESSKNPQVTNHSSISASLSFSDEHTSNKKTETEHSYETDNQQKNSIPSPLLLQKKRKQTTISFYVEKPQDSSEASSAKAPKSDHVDLVESDKAPTNIAHMAKNDSTSCPKNDIGNFFQNVSSLSDAQKYDLLCNVWKPPSSYSFPPNSSGRKFQAKWLCQYKWLVYSQIYDGAFCMDCVLFGGESSHNASKLTCLYKFPLIDWCNASRRLKNHEAKSQVHATASLRKASFHDFVTNKTTSVDILCQKAASEQVVKNREALKPIVESVLFCGRQNISLRGHRDDSSYLDETKNNPGNLQALLSFLVRCGNNAAFNDHMDFAPKNATYKSKTTQNELIRICGSIITKQIINEAKKAKFFSVLADEAADVSNLEQMAIVIRFVDEYGMVREDFVGFAVCDEGLKGVAVAKKIETAISDLGLDMNNCRGQGYDGAGNMSGKCSGASTIIRNKYPNALYVHCRSHVLNLAVASSCDIPVISNMMSHVKAVSDFFNVHPKRFAELEKNIKNLKLSRHNHLIDVCRTRWIARIDGLDVFIEIFEAVVVTLEFIKSNVDRSWSRDAVHDASGLFHGTISFEFIICLVVVSRLLEMTRPLTKQLQSSSIDVIACIEKVNLLLAMLARFRNELNINHDTMYAEAVEIASKVGTTPSKPRTSNIQKHKANTPADSPSEYFRRTISAPFLDHLTTQIRQRFSDQNMMVLNAFYALPKCLSRVYWIEKFSLFLSMYEKDLPEPRYLQTELKMWESKWQMFEGNQPDTISALLPVIDKLTFPNIYTALAIAATIPVTTCSCERSISVLRRLKTYLRNSMSESRMNGLAMLNVHREIQVDVDDVIDQFAREHPRRMLLKDILNSDPKDPSID